jgi:hypothetical protein
LRNPAFVAKAERQLQVQKTYKLYIGGKFVRGENGRVLPASGANGTLIANYCRCQKKLSNLFGVDAIAFFSYDVESFVQSNWPEGGCGQIRAPMG